MSLPGYIMMKGNTSTSESLTVALNFAKTANPAKILTLFVTVIHNYSEKRPYNGFRMNQLHYSAHPEERELLIMEGAAVAVLGIDEFVVDNKQAHSEEEQELWDNINGKSITVVYLFHTTHPGQ